MGKAIVRTGVMVRHKSHALRNARRSALIWSLLTVHMPWEKPGYTLSVEPLTSFADSMRRRADRHDLIVVSVQDERRHVDPLEILGEVRFGKRLDAVDDAL